MYRTISLSALFYRVIQIRVVSTLGFVVAHLDLFPSKSSCPVRKMALWSQSVVVLKFRLGFKFGSCVRSGNFGGGLSV